MLRRLPCSHIRYEICGFTLLEVLVALVVGLTAIGAVYSVYRVQVREHRYQRTRLALQQNLRGALVFMEQEIRLAGFDPEDSGRFGIVDVRRFDLMKGDFDPGGQPALFYTLDADENGEPDTRNHHRNKEHCNFRIYHEPKTAHRYLAWDSGSGRKPVSESIQALGLAYGVDRDNDGRLDRWRGGPYSIWAVDADNDNLLDTHIDTNNDGMIDEKDDTDNDGRITQRDGCELEPPVPLNRIKSVRVWLLAQSTFQLQGYMDHRTYVIGDRVFPAANDGYVRKVLETIVNCRNL